MRAMRSLNGLVILTLLFTGITTPTPSQNSPKRETPAVVETIEADSPQPPPPDPAARSAPALAESPPPSSTGTMKIDDSTVNTVLPDLLPPAIAFDLCFNVTVESPDLEYMDRFDVDLPDDWTVNSVAATPSSTGEITKEGVEAGNVVYWQDSDYPPQTGLGAWWSGTYDFCANVTAPNCTGEPWSFPWNIVGDGWGSPLHSVTGTAGPVQCLSSGVYLTPDSVQVEGCNGVTQTHTFDALNNTGADGTFDLSYTLAEPTYGTLIGPASLTISDVMTASLAGTLTPKVCLPGGLDLVATVEASGNGYTGTAVITKTIVTGPPCPVCDQMGWLAGHAHDYDDISATCTDATVHVEPENLDVAVNASGYYTVSLVPFEYAVSASAAGYPEPDGPYTVTVGEGAVTSRDFRLVRPDIAVAPTSLSASAVATSTVTRTFTISNSSAYTLEYEIREMLLPMDFSTTAQPAGRPGIEVEPALRATMAAEGTASYLIYFRERPDLSPAFGMGWVERGRFVVKALRETAERSQARVRAHLDRHGVDYKTFWIDNVIVVESSSRATFNGLLTFPEIGALRARRHPQLIEPVERRSAGFNVMAVESNIAHVGADQVWSDFGITGEGIVVASIDTGVRYTHNALVDQYRGNLGGGAFNHNHNWWDPSLGGQNLVPNDHDGHGSHTMGIMVGDDGAGNQIGMAPGAQWIACQAFEVSDVELLECGQFMAAPWDLTGANPTPDLRPHVVNNSWGDCLQYADHWYDGVINAWHALGIYPAFANGNASNCGYSQPPGCNTVGNPARAGNVTGVGSTGRSNGQYATHSNWGPTDDPDTVNPRGYPDLKPQVLAPGVSIRSAYRTSDSAYASMSGTSMSTPHVAGLIALMWQAASCLVGDYATTETIIEYTATPIPYASGCGGEGPGDVPNQATGWGEINAPAAVQAAMDYCNTNWLPWVATTPVTGTLASGAQTVEVAFTCGYTESQKPQPLEGKLLIQHNDPCEDDVEIGLEFFCISSNPVPVWDKEIWVNGEERTPVAGPHTVHAGDTVVIVDRVGAAFSQTITAVLTETWGDALELVDYDVGGVGTVTTDTHTLIWDLNAVAPNTFYPITKAFEVQYGSWTTAAITESYAVEGALVQPDAVAVVFERHVPAITLVKNGPASADVDSTIRLTLVISSDGSFGGAAVLTDALPAGMIYAGNLAASAGLAWEGGNVIHWVYTDTLVTWLGEGLERGTVLSPGWTVQAMPAAITITFDVQTSDVGDICNVAKLDWGEDYTGDEHCIKVSVWDKLYLPIVLRNHPRNDLYLPIVLRDS
jgi:subtilisin family serine protease